MNVLPRTAPLAVVLVGLTPLAGCAVNPEPAHARRMAQSVTHPDGGVRVRRTPRFPAALWVLQCGDPSGTGEGGPGYAYRDENLPTGEAVPYPRGTVAIANRGPDTNRSQFFINYDDNDIPAAYPVFGRVTDGMAIVDEVAEAGHDGKYDRSGGGGGAPMLTITIESITVRPA